MSENTSSAGLFWVAGETTSLQLMQVLSTTVTEHRSLPGFEGTSAGLNRLLLGVDCDEVYPNLFIGDVRTAMNKEYLRRIGITHILNAAEGTNAGMVNTNANFYNDYGISYMGLPVEDLPYSNISQYFLMAAEFINHCVMTGGKVLIHCVRGRSRSATILVAYLMIKLRLPAPMGLCLCTQKRTIHPNEGFVIQLAHLHNSLCSIICAFGNVQCKTTKGDCNE